MVIKCISVRQPFAYAIFRLGKDIENRTRATKYRGLIYIQASAAAPARDYMAEVNRKLTKGGHDKAIEYSDMLLGYIIGRVNLVDCVTKSKSPWFNGPFGYVLEDATEIVPIRVKGKLGIYDLVLPANAKITSL